MDVLKQYKSNRINYIPFIYTCYGIDEEGDAVCIVTREDGRKHSQLINKEEFKFFTEYKPLRKGTVWVNIYEDGMGSSGLLWANKELAIRYTADHRGKLLATVEVPWVEGQGLDRDPNHTHDCGCGKCNNDKYNCI